MTIGLRVKIKALYLASVTNLLLGVLLVGMWCISFLIADQSSPPYFLLNSSIIFGMPGIFFLYWGTRAAAKKSKLDASYAEQSRREAEARARADAEQARGEAEVRAQAVAEEDAAPETEVDRERRVELRDADSQDTPYEYQCIGHPNVTLALRYGIANTSRSSGGEGRSIRENSAIRLRKIEKVQEDSAGAIYLAELPDFGSRKVRVVIRPGTEFVLTFLPISDTWFNEHEDLERLLKDNPTFTLKELATFHVQAVLNAKR